MKLWTLVIDSDNGTECEIFTSEAALNDRCLALIRLDWRERFGLMPNDWREAWDVLDAHSPDWWLVSQEHDVEV